MTRQEEIREGIDDILIEGIDADGHFHCEKTVIALLAYLHSQGCVLWDSDLDCRVPLMEE